MHKLRTAVRPEDYIPPEEILDTLLVESGAAGHLPTNERRILSFLGLEQLSFDFMNELEFLDTPQKPEGELRAALHLGERVVATQSGMGEKRTRFSVFHEVAHCVLPEHHAKLFVDTDQTLSWWAKARFEREANQFAADLLFQGRRFTEQALSRDTSLKTVLDLAPRYGASYEAAFRRFTEFHTLPCALIVYQKTSQNDESFVEDDDYGIQYSITSAPFRKLFFASVRMTDDKCKLADIAGPQESLRTGQTIERELTIENQNKEKWRFETEIFSNGYKIFQFLRRPILNSSRQAR